MKFLTLQEAINKYEERESNLPYISTNALEKLEEKGYEYEMQRSGKNYVVIEEMLKSLFRWYKIKSIRFAETNWTCIKGLRTTVIIFKGIEKEIEVEE